MSDELTARGETTYRAVVSRSQDLEVEFTVPAGVLTAEEIEVLAFEAAVDGWFEAETTDTFILDPPTVVEEPA